MRGEERRSRRGGERREGRRGTSNGRKRRLEIKPGKEEESMWRVREWEGQGRKTREGLEKIIFLPQIGRAHV